MYSRLPRSPTASCTVLLYSDLWYIHPLHAVFYFCRMLEAVLLVVLTQAKLQCYQDCKLIGHRVASQRLLLFMIWKLVDIFPPKQKKKSFFSFLPLKWTQIEQRGPNTFQHLFPCFIKAGKLGVGSSTLMFSTVVMKHIKKWWIWQRHEDICRVAAANPHTFVGNRSWTQTRHSV